MGVDNKPWSNLQYACEERDRAGLQAALALDVGCSMRDIQYGRYSPLSLAQTEPTKFEWSQEEGKYPNVYPIPKGWLVMPCLEIDNDLIDDLESALKPWSGEKEQAMLFPRSFQTVGKMFSPKAKSLLNAEVLRMILSFCPRLWFVPNWEIPQNTCGYGAIWKSDLNDGLRFPHSAD